MIKLFSILFFLFLGCSKFEKFERDLAGIPKTDLKQILLQSKEGKSFSTSGRVVEVGPYETWFLLDSKGARVLVACPDVLNTSILLSAGKRNVGVSGVVQRGPNGEILLFADEVYELSVSKDKKV